MVLLRTSIAALGLAACTAADPTVDEAPPPPLTAPVRVTDVSVLVPLPHPSLRTSLIAADAAGPHGKLLSEELFAQLPQLETFTENPAFYGLLRVVAVRLDPCFPKLDASDPEGCRSQVRLVMQPVLPIDRDGTLVLGTVDAAIHTFYAVPREELELLLRHLVAARAEAVPDAADGPLGPHPALAAQGPEGTFAATLQQRLLDVAGDDNLTRVTFMSVENIGDTWRFGGFDVHDGELVPFSIPTVDNDDQIFTNRDLAGGDFRGGFASPEPSSADSLAFWFESTSALDASTDAQRAAFASALRVESPAFHDPDTIDCVTCHVAASAHAWATARLGLDAADFEEAYRDASGALVPGATVVRTDTLRAFGYFEEHPAVSQRVANESRAVAAFFDANR